MSATSICKGDRAALELNEHAIEFDYESRIRRLTAPLHARVQSCICNHQPSCRRREQFFVCRLSPSLHEGRAVVAVVYLPDL